MFSKLTFTDGSINRLTISKNNYKGRFYSVAQLRDRLVSYDHLLSIKPIFGALLYRYKSIRKFEIIILYQKL